jgi:integrase
LRRKDVPTRRGCRWSTRRGAAPSRKYPLRDGPINLRELNATFQKLARTLGVRVGRKDDGLAIHSLRHFFETRCVNSRVAQLVSGAWMGRAGDGSMARAYYGRSDGASQRFMKRARFVKAAKKPQQVLQPFLTKESKL